MSTTQRANDSFDSADYYFNIEMDSRTSDDFNLTDQAADTPLTFYSSPSLICGVIMIVTAFTGIIGNVITAMVFSYRKKPSKADASSSTSIGGYGAGSYISASSSPSPTPAAPCRLSSIAILVTGLACVDAILLSVSCPLFASSAFYAYNPTLPLLNAVSIMTRYIYPIANVFQSASVWTLSVITIER